MRDLFKAPFQCGITIPQFRVFEDIHSFSSFVKTTRPIFVNFGLLDSENLANGMRCFYWESWIFTRTTSVWKSKKIATLFVRLLSSPNIKEINSFEIKSISLSSLNAWLFKNIKFVKIALVVFTKLEKLQKQNSD